MKKQHVTGQGIKDLSREESKNLTGGSDLIGNLKFTSATITSGGGGGLRSFVLGLTIFGMARMCGVMVGSSSL